MLMTFSIILFSLVSLVLCVAILLQADKGNGLGAGIGGGVATTEVFGGRGPGSSLRKVTITCAILYMSGSAWLAYLSSKPQSALDLSNSKTAVSSSEDPVVEVGTLQVNPNGTPLGSSPKIVHSKEDAPKLDAPKLDAPKEDAPRLDAPKLDAPKLDAPKLDAPKLDAPKLDVPKLDAPKADAPKLDAPKLDAPKVDTKTP